jgi:hypothetical protein
LKASIARLGRSTGLSNASTGMMNASTGMMNASTGLRTCLLRRKYSEYDGRGMSVPLDYSPHASAPRPPRWVGVHAAATLLTGGLALLMSYGGYARGFADGAERVRVYLLIALSTASLVMSCVRVRTARRTTGFASAQRTLLVSAILAGAMIAGAMFFCAARFG